MIISAQIVIVDLTPEKLEEIQSCLEKIVNPDDIDIATYEQKEKFNGRQTD